MHAERDELVKYVFPHLRALCESRGVTWGEVDLRWGITDEEKAEGKVLPLCLEEIKGCRPYFIGLLGERYGWIPEEITSELIEAESWLSEHLNHSVTELEIIYGVLKNPDMAEHAFFYFRDPAYIDSLPADIRVDFIEIALPHEVANAGQEQAELRVDERKRKLFLLKDKIRDSCFPVSENYPTPKALGDLVLNDITNVINTRYPEGSIPDPLVRDASDHEQFARSRSRIYIRSKKSFAMLDRHVKGKGKPLVVLGESGSGKSALLSMWALQYKEDHPDEMLVMHFIGATPFSSDWVLTVKRIMEEFKRRFDIQQPIPDKPDELKEAFANWLSMAAARGRAILVLDALNQLEDRDAALDLAWLPPVIPKNIRLIVSTLAGRPLDEIERRGWKSIVVVPLTKKKREQIIDQYLGQFAKKLPKSQNKLIANSPQTANPLYLKVLLDELRVLGEKAVDRKIEYYLEAQTIDGLYEKVLNRYEQDYERDRPGLVRESMSLLWAARRGLSEAELLDLLGQGGQHLPRAYWSPLYLATKESLVSRSGLLNFFHDYLRKAAMDRYLLNDIERKAAHLRLANYFELRKFEMRAIDELPWQLARAEEWQRLYDLLKNPEYFLESWESNEFDVKRYWALISGNSDLKIIDAYKSLLDEPEKNIECAEELSRLFYDSGYLDQALSLKEFLINYYKSKGDKLKYQEFFGEKALILYDRGNLENAFEMFREQEKIYREIDDKEGLQNSLGSQGLILYDWGKLDEALIIFQEEERLCREIENKLALQGALDHQALVLYDRGDLDDALKLFKEEEKICRDIGNEAELQVALGRIGLVLYDKGNYDGAMKLFKKQEKICLDLGIKAFLQVAYSNRAAVFYDHGNLDEAMALHKEEERICRELGDFASLHISLGRQGIILYDKGKFEEAMALFKEEERISHDLKSPFGLQCAYGNQAMVLYDAGKLDEAMALHKEEERICRELGNFASLHISLGRQGIILYDKGKFEEAMALFKEEERISHDLKSPSGIQCSYGNQGLVLYDSGDLDGALALHKEEEKICRAMGDKFSLQSSLCRQGHILYDKGNLDGAMDLFREQESLCRELDDISNLGVALDSQGKVCCARSQYEEAMALHKEAEKINRELKDPYSLQGTLGLQGNVLHAQGDLEGALSLHKEEERICRELGNKVELEKSLEEQGAILVKQGDLVSAMKVFQEQAVICSELGLKKELPKAYYSMALVRAKQNEQSEAIRYMSKAADCGYSNIDEIVSQPDFVAFKDAKEFKDILGKIKENLRGE
jgi:tetratricopeptide (TPR) repeat protein